MQNAFPFRSSAFIINVVVLRCKGYTLLANFLYNHSTVLLQSSFALLVYSTRFWRRFYSQLFLHINTAPTSPDHVQNLHICKKMYMMFSSNKLAQCVLEGVTFLFMRFGLFKLDS